MPIMPAASLTATVPTCWPRCPRGGVVGVLECATHSGDAQKVLELAHTAPYFHAALGIHPESLIEEDAATVAVYHGDWRAELAAMRPLYDDPPLSR